MTTQAHRLIQDQNSSFLYTGENCGVKTDATTKPDRKGGAVGARRALNDISNSRKPTLFQANTKEASKKAFSIEKDIAVNPKYKISKASEKGTPAVVAKHSLILQTRLSPLWTRFQKLWGSGK